MKKFLAMMIVMTLLLSCVAMCANAQYGYTYTALKGTPKIDGEIDGIWNDAKVVWTKVDHLNDAKNERRSDQLMQVKVLWDEEALYFLAQVTVSAEDLADFADLFEVYISEANTKSEGDYTTGDSQTCVRFADGSFVTPENITSQDVNKESGEGLGKNSRHATSTAANKKLSNGYIVEVKIPFTTIKGEAGKEIGLEFMLNIMKADKTFVNALRWNVDVPGLVGKKDKAPWQSTEDWGVLILDAKEATAPAVEESKPETSKPAETNPGTGDMFSVFAVVALVSLAGTVVVAKKRG